MEANIPNERLRALFADLIQLSAAPGFEHEVRAFVLEALREIDCEVETDVMGNVVARAGQQEGTTILLAAHMDEVGLMITRIEDSGFLRFRPLGFPVESLLPGNIVRIGQDMYGIIGTRDWHVTPADRRGEIPSVEELFIDIGASTGDEARSWGVRVGAPVTFRAGCYPLGRSGHVIGTKSVDNRVACAIGIEILRQVQRTDSVGVTVLFAVQEEVGFRGASIAMDGIHVDCAIALDNALTEDTPFYPPATKESVRVGRGPLLCLREEYTPAVIGMIAHPGMVEWVRRAATTHRIPLQEGFLYPSGATDAVAIYQRHGGIPTVYVGVPSRYAHSPAELVDLRDLDATHALVAALVNEAAAKPWLD